MNMFMDTLIPGTAALPAEDLPVRAPLWDTHLMLRCPVAGICLSVSEQRRLCRRVGAAESRKSDFAVHELIVATMGTENPLSRKLDTLLARKFEKASRNDLRMPEAQFLQAWHAALARGECQRLLWTAAVRRLSPGGVEEVFGSLHMTVHEYARGHARLCSALRKSESREEHLLLKYNEQREQIRALVDMNRRLKAAQPESQRLPTGDHGQAEMLADLRRQLVLLEEEVLDREMQLESLQDRHQALQTEHEQLRREYETHLCLDATMRKACAGDQCIADRCEGNCTPSCPSFSLCEKRVLIVGGIERMEKAYRKFVEERGGTLEYHAGHMKARKALENSVQRADVVLCPVNCNSHGACLMVKNLGKKYRKSVHMLSNFSLSSLARTVDALPEVQ